MNAFSLAITLLWDLADRGNKEVYTLNLTLLKKRLRLYNSDGNIQRMFDDALAAAERHGADKDDLAIFRALYIDRNAGAKELSERYHMHHRNIYKRVDRVLSFVLMPIIFGIDGIEFP